MSELESSADQIYDVYKKTVAHRRISQINQGKRQS
jgi:hypothetical protein